MSLAAGFAVSPRHILVAPPVTGEPADTNVSRQSNGRQKPAVPPLTRRNYDSRNHSAAPARLPGKHCVYMENFAPNGVHGLYLLLPRAVQSWDHS